MQSEYHKTIDCDHYSTPPAGLNSPNPSFSPRVGSERKKKRTSSTLARLSIDDPHGRAKNRDRLEALSVSLVDLVGAWLAHLVPVGRRE